MAKAASRQNPVANPRQLKYAHGSLAERFKAPVLKTGEGLSPP